MGEAGSAAASVILAISQVRCCALILDVGGRIRLARGSCLS